jgi:ribosomal protein S12 methylthiotransferase accessory factor
MDDCAMNSTNNWRSTTSEDALKLILNNFRRFGISRIANITHLDILGFPVYIGLPPRGKTLSVSAGKGLTHVDSIVSAAMESIEIDVAENVDKGEYYICSYNELPRDSLLPFEFAPLACTVFLIETLL